MNTLIICGIGPRVLAISVDFHPPMISLIVKLKQEEIPIFTDTLSRIRESKFSPIMELPEAERWVRIDTSLARM